MVYVPFSITQSRRGQAGDPPLLASARGTNDDERVDEQVRPLTTLRNSKVSASDATVFLNWVSLEEDLWLAVWQHGDERRHLDGTRAEAVAWALAQEATSYWIFSADADDYVPLTADSAAD